MECIAHRGASGYLPEHTLPAYALAYGQGAHWIEPDVVLTGNDVPIALHDRTLGRTTDVATRFPDRHRDDGLYYAADFSYAEIARLRVVEPRPNRYPYSTFRVPALQDVLELVDGLNRTTGRNVGVYPELKHPELQPELADAGWPCSAATGAGSPASFDGRRSRGAHPRCSLSAMRPIPTNRTGRDRPYAGDRRIHLRPRG